MNRREQKRELKRLRSEYARLSYSDPWERQDKAKLSDRITALDRKLNGCGEFYHRGGG